MPPTANPELFRCRNFRIFVLNDALKNLGMRAKVINDWKEQGGVLLMGYELYRQLATKKPRKPKKKKKKGEPELPNMPIVDIEEEDESKKILDGE